MKALWMILPCIVALQSPMVEAKQGKSSKRQAAEDPWFFMSHTLETTAQRLEMVSKVTVLTKDRKRAPILAYMICRWIWDNALDVQMTLGHQIVDENGHLVGPVDVLTELRQVVLRRYAEPTSEQADEVGLLGFQSTMGMEVGSIAWRVAKYQAH